MLALKSDFHLTRPRMLAYLSDGLQSQSEESSTLCLPPGLTLTEVESYIRTACPEQITTQIANLAQASNTGFCLFCGPVISLILPPFPVRERSFFGRVETRPLVSALEMDWMISLVLVRLGAYAIGVFRGEKRLVSKVGTGLVHGRHRQGGSSANRFYRHRQKQIEQFLLRVCRHIDECIGPFQDQLDYATYGGAWTTIESLKKQCPLLDRIRAYELPPLLDIGEPRQDVLETAIGRVWSSHVIQWDVSR